MLLPVQSKPAVRHGRRRPSRGADGRPPGVLPLHEEDDGEDAGSGEADESDESGEY